MGNKGNYRRAERTDVVVDRIGVKRVKIGNISRHVPGDDLPFSVRVDLVAMEITIDQRAHSLRVCPSCTISYAAGRFCTRIGNFSMRAASSSVKDAIALRRPINLE